MGIDTTSGYWNRSQVQYKNFEIIQSTEFPTNVTTLLTFINNEDRALALLGLDAKELGDIRHIHLIIINRDLDDYDNPALDKLIENAKEAVGDKELTFDIHYLNFFDENFSIHLTKILREEEVFDKPLMIDITSCPYPVIIPLSEVILSHHTRKLIWAYTVPEEYDTKLIEEIEDQVKGATVKIYGDYNPEGQYVLAIIAGYEDKKAQLVHDMIKPEIGYLFNNLFTRNIEELKKAKEVMELHREMIEIQDYKQFNLDRYDVNRILNSLLLLDQRNTNDQLVIAPFGSKIQRLASMLFVTTDTGRLLADVIPDELSFNKISHGINQTLFYQVRRNIGYAT